MPLDPKQLAEQQAAAQAKRAAAERAHIQRLTTAKPIQKTAPPSPRQERTPRFVVPQRIEPPPPEFKAEPFFALSVRKRKNSAGLMGYVLCTHRFGADGDLQETIESAVGSAGDVQTWFKIAAVEKVLPK